MKGDEPFSDFEIGQAAKVLAMLDTSPYNGWNLNTLIILLRAIK